MGKSHRDNHKARKKRGPSAFKKKVTRRNPKKVPCKICGTHTRKNVLQKYGICPKCSNKYLEVEIIALTQKPTI